MSRENKRALAALAIVLGSVLVALVVGGNPVQSALLAIGADLALFGYAMFREAGAPSR